MITPFVITLGTAYVVHRLTHYEENKIKNKWKLTMIGAGISNKLNETFEIMRTIQAEYGYCCYLTHPEGMTYTKLFDDEVLPKIEDSLNCILELKKDKMSSDLVAKIIDKDLTPYPYKEVKTTPWQLYCGLSFSHNQIIIDMRRMAHLLICGTTNMGKSTLETVILLNLVQFSASEVNLYLLQLAKSDMYEFRKFPQVKDFIEAIEGALKVFDKIFKIVMERDNLFKSIRDDEGIRDIFDYNEIHKNSKLPIVYIVIEEFSFIMPHEADKPERTRAKENALNQLEQILRIGRSTGVYVVINNLRPDRENLPPFLKNLLTNVVTFRQTNTASALVAIDDTSAAKLPPWQAIYKSETDLIHFKGPYLTRTSIKDRYEKYLSDNQIEIPKAYKKETLRQTNIEITLTSSEVSDFKHGIREINKDREEYNKIIEQKNQEKQIDGKTELSPEEVLQLEEFKRNKANQLKQAEHKRNSIKKGVRK